MIYLKIATFCAVLCVCWTDDLRFPAGFKFGVATSAYQIEGAWNVSDKGESIWDRYTHNHPEWTKYDTGDVACDSYHLWKEDVKIVKELGVHSYRFSIAWSRLMPSGFSNYISAEGTKYYSDLIDELLKNNIEPIVTLYHWDLPQKLQDFGGWLNPLIADWFADYARVVYKLYGNRVTTWITINEPFVICDAAYNTVLMAPDVIDIDRAMYVCNKNILMAHAKAWRIYDEEFKPLYKGKVSIDNHIIWLEPETPEEQNITELARDYQNGRFINPIYSKEGGWPTAVEQIIADNSKKQGYLRSRLEPFTDEERKLVQGTYDYFAINQYASRAVRRAKPGELIPNWPVAGGIPELGAVFRNRPEWGIAGDPYFSINPDGLRNVLNYMKNRYGDLEFVILENGYGSYDSTLEDDDRVHYIDSYMAQILLAIKDGVNVTRYTVWTMMDNFEWNNGYKLQFGLYKVDFTDPKRQRTARKSARFYSQVIKNHSLNVTVT